MVMRKACDVHGSFKSVVEVDPLFYGHCLENNGGIYAGHLVDVTTRCNLRCRYCYYEKGPRDISLETILDNCRAADGPYILTGGEPTIRPGLLTVIDEVQEIGRAILLTNGYGLQDPAFLRALASRLTDDDGITHIGLSFHPEAPWFSEVMRNLRTAKLKLTTVFFVVDSLDQLPMVKKFAEYTSDLFHSFRIKIASAIWDEGKSAHLFTSDVINWFLEQPGETELADTGKITYYMLKHNNLLYAVVNWYNVDNIDLLDIDTPPTYTTKDGRVMDFVKAMVLNEGTADGPISHRG